ncbi:MAG: ABC transporter ATP-binding protein [Opitutaceae bacterium]|jgi:NitT/TauT family transport system ATP-binding protein
MSDSPPIVELQSVTKRFGDSDRPPVFANLSLRAEPGEFISLIGASGCGKSTLLRLLSGLSSPSSGRVLIEGQSPETSSSDRAFIFQDAALLPWRTVRQNAETLLQLRGTPAARRHELSAQLLDLARIGHLADRYPRQLSGGEKMRVSIARALTLEPSLLLLDEPFGALDELTREHLNEELLALRERRHWTAFFVTHSVAEAVFLSTRILILAGGRIAHDLPVALPYPRNADTRETSAYLNRVAEVSRLLHAAVSA